MNKQHVWLAFLLSCFIASESWAEGFLSSGFEEGYSSQGITANARRLSFNGQVLPSSSFYVPNSFVNSDEHRFYSFLHGIGRVRTVGSKQGCQPDCSDAIAYAEADVWKDFSHSLTMQASLHSLTGRNGGTGFGEGASLGFKFARRITNKTSFSFSGEHIVQLDDTVDLGRNYFLGMSTFVEGKLFGLISGLGYNFNLGVGSGLYTLYDNELFSTNSIFGKGGFSSEDETMKWGLIGSASYFLSDKLSVGAEFIGFGFGVGASVKPFQTLPLTFTGYLYDVLGNFPDGIPCAEDPCTPRLYGRASYSF